MANSQSQQAMSQAMMDAIIRNQQNAAQTPGLLGPYSGPGYYSNTYPSAPAGYTAVSATTPYYSTGPFQRMESALQAYKEALLGSTPATPVAEKDAALYSALEQMRQVINTLASQLAREVSAAGAREAAAALREQEAASIKAFIANSHPDVLKDYYAFTQIRDKLSSK